MKYQTRENVSETNSSSAHSLVVTKSNEFYTMEEIREDYFVGDTNSGGKIDIWGIEEFGRRYDILSTFREKLEFAIASLLGNCYSIKSFVDAEKKFSEEFVPLIEELAGVDEVTIARTFRDFRVYSDSVDWDDDEQDITTYEEVPYDDLMHNENGKDWDDYYLPVGKSGRDIEVITLDDLMATGGIDHQSVGLLENFMKQYNVSLREFLTRKNIIVVIDGDEMQIFRHMTEAGLIDEDNIALQYPTKGMHYDKYNDWLGGNN